jgi:hypothetical protein
MSTLRIYKAQGGHQDIRLDEPGACVEVIMDDGRAYQMYVMKTGDVSLRAWGNTPMLVGNATEASYYAEVPVKEPTTDMMGMPLKAAAKAPTS